MSNTLDPLTIKIVSLSFEFLTTFVITWFMVLLMSLPFGISETEEDNSQGFATSAPKEPKIKKKMIVTTIISLIITILFQIIINSGIVNLRSLIE